MTQYNTLNVKLSNSQLNKLKFGIKNGTEVTLKLSSNVVGDSNDENNFLHKLLLTNTLITKLHKVNNKIKSFCLKCRKNPESENQKVVKTKKRKNNVFIKI